MFKYQIDACTNQMTKPVTIALSGFCDVAEYIRDHAKEVLDPDGTLGLKVNIIEHEKVDSFIRFAKKKEGGKYDDEQKSTY